jgi:NACHT domain
MESVRSPNRLLPVNLLIPSGYRSWIREEHSLVCCSAFASVEENLILFISSAIIQDIVVLCEADRASMAYFYFDFRDAADKQNRRNLLLSLLSQLSAQSDSCFDVLFRLYSKHGNGAQKPGDGVLTQCLKEMLLLTNHDPTYIILDALDECPNSSGVPSAREQVLQLLKDLNDLSLPNLHICVTSRPEIDIRTVLEPLAFCAVSLHDQNGQRQDIAGYVTSVVFSDLMMKRWREEDKNLVIETLVEKADGM